MYIFTIFSASRSIVASRKTKGWHESQSFHYSHRFYFLLKSLAHIQNVMHVQATNAEKGTTLRYHVIFKTCISGQIYHRDRVGGNSLFQFISLLDGKHMNPYVYYQTPIKFEHVLSSMSLTQQKLMQIFFFLFSSKRS